MRSAAAWALVVGAIIATPMLAVALGAAAVFLPVAGLLVLHGEPRWRRPAELAMACSVALGFFMLLASSVTIGSASGSVARVGGIAGGNADQVVDVTWIYLGLAPAATLLATGSRGWARRLAVSTLACMLALFVVAWFGSPPGRGSDVVGPVVVGRNLFLVLPFLIGGVAFVVMARDRVARWQQGRAAADPDA